MMPYFRYLSVIVISPNQIIKIMPKKNEHLRKRNEDIRRDFKELSSQGFKSHIIYESLAKKYYMANITIDDIVWRNGIYKDF
jgi:hypothetical protein